MKKLIILLLTHLGALVAGFAGGIYALPILTAPDSPAVHELDAAMKGSQFRAAFRRDLAGSDAFHWGEGEVSISEREIALRGNLAPGPDYRLYLAPEFVEDEQQFQRIKSRSRVVGDVKTFENFLVPVPADVNPRDYNTVVVWCESFGEFISAAQYQ